MSTFCLDLSAGRASGSSSGGAGSEKEQAPARPRSQPWCQAHGQRCRVRDNGEQRRHLPTRPVQNSQRCSEPSQSYLINNFRTQLAQWVVPQQPTRRARLTLAGDSAAN